MVKDAGSATVIAPMIKDYLDVSIKNDDQLVKLSAVLQRFLSGTSGSDDSDSGGVLTDSEKEELLKNVRSEVEEITKAETIIDGDLDTLKKKKSNK